MKIIILLLIISLLTKRKPSNYLYCGLFGWVGARPSYFDRHAFSILGMANDSRGGDSCGVYYDNTVIYGTGVNKDFPSFIKKIDPIKAGKDLVVMGHTRKASIGGAIANNAQPIALKNKDESLGFILTHNGTLTNHEELADKYHLDFDNLDTDSQVLAAIMFFTKAGFDVLEEYNGTAALVFHFPGNNTIYIFKGESPNTSTYKHASEERPLYGCVDRKGSFYYSSVKDPLDMIAKDTDDVKDIRTNTLYKVTAGEIEAQFKIDRSNCYQRYVKPYVHHNSHTPVNGYRGDVHGQDYFGFEGWEYDSRNRGHERSDVEYHYPHISIVEESFISLGDQMINYTRGRYHLGKNLVHGKVTMNEYGLVIDPEVWKKMYYTLYFWEGIILVGSEEFNALNAMKKEKKVVAADSPLLLESTPYPVAPFEKGSDFKRDDFKLHYMNSSLEVLWSYDGKYTPVFCNKTYHTKDGLLTRTTNNSTIEKLKDYHIENLKA